MPTFSNNQSYLSAITPSGVPIFNPYQGFYSPITQVLANQFPSWMDLRNNTSDPGQQYLNAFAIQLQDIQRNYKSVQDSFYIQTTDLNQADILYTIQLPRNISLNKVAPALTGDGINLFVIDDINQFLYKSFPTRIVLDSIQNNSTAIFTDELAYDIAWTDVENNNHTLYYNASSGQLQKYYYTDQLPLGANPAINAKEILGTYMLTDINGNPITDIYKGATLYQDWLYILFGNTLYLFDARIPIQTNAISGFTPNQEVTTIQALTQTVLSETLSSSNKIALDITNKFLWVQNNNLYNYYELYFDYATIDYNLNIVYMREKYTSVTANNISYPITIFNLWNALDEFGSNELNTPRLLGEKNVKYQSRLLNVMKFRSNSTAQGLVNAITLNLGLSGFYGYWASGSYPQNIYPDQNYVSGYPYYLSGVYPTGLYNIAKINALFDPFFYQTVVDPATNIPSSSFCSYTREILQTFPILWGSGIGDPYAFKWDLTPFDGGLNYTSVVPNFFGNAYIGVSGIYFQSGVSNPESDQLTVQLVRTSGDIWQPEIKTGDFFINSNPYHLYANAGYELIPSGILSYTISGSYINTEKFTVADTIGQLAPSGTEFIQISQFDNIYPYEYQVSGNNIIFSGTHDALGLWYETSNNNIYVPSGWDFNPVHTALPDGFLWISNEQQAIDVSGSYSFTVSPTQLFFGQGGGSVGIGKLLDTTGQPIAGASTFFQLTGPGTLFPTNSLTSLDGRTFTFYQPNTDFSSAISSGLYTSGNILVVSGNITANPSDIFTIQILADPSFVPSGQYLPTTTRALLTQNNSHTLSIAAADWSSGNYMVTVSGINYGPFAGQYIIGGIGSGIPNNFANNDDAYNIDLSSLQLASNQTIYSVNSSGSVPAANIYYDADNYFNPLPYGRAALYSVTIPTGITNIKFNTFSPVSPVAISGNTPSPGLSSIIYPIPLPQASGYEIASPTIATITSYATWNGVSTIPISGVINLGFAPQQLGVFGLDKSPVDFLSYLRYIGV